LAVLTFLSSRCRAILMLRWPAISLHGEQQHERRGWRLLDSTRRIAGKRYRICIIVLY
jgi:hypothetical protein